MTRLSVRRQPRPPRQRRSGRGSRPLRALLKPPSPRRPVTSRPSGHAASTPGRRHAPDTATGDRPRPPASTERRAGRRNGAPKRRATPPRLPPGRNEESRQTRNAESRAARPGRRGDRAGRRSSPSSSPTTPTTACRSSPPTTSRRGCPNADALVKGNEVRIGGVRVGVVESVGPGPERRRQRRRRSSTSASTRTSNRCPVDSTIDHPAEVGARPQVPADRPRQLRQGLPGGRNDPALGGHARTGRHRPVLRHVRRADPEGDPGATWPASATPSPAAARSSTKRSARCAAARKRRAGAAQARLARDQLRPASARRSRSSPPTVAPVAETQAQHVRRPRHDLRRLRQRLPALHPGNDLKEPADRWTRRRRPAGDAALPRTTPHASSPPCSRASRRWPRPRRRSPSALVTGIPVLHGLAGSSTPSCRRPRRRWRPSTTTPGVLNGLDRLIDTNEVARPADQVHRPGPDRLQLRDAALPQPRERRQPGTTAGNWQRGIAFSTPPGPNSEGSPPRRPANGGGGRELRRNHLHVNPYPNTASPGQTARVRGRQRALHVGQQSIGNPPGNQGTAPRARSPVS